MRNLNILLKNNFNKLVGALKGKKGRSTVAATSLLIVLCVAIVGIYTFQAWTMFDGLGMFGLEKMCLFLFIFPLLVSSIFLHKFE